MKSFGKSTTNLIFSTLKVKFYLLNNCKSATSELIKMIFTNRHKTSLNTKFA
jgi:hypothetical protein